MTGIDMLLPGSLLGPLQQNGGPGRVSFFHQPQRVRDFSATNRA